MSARDEQILEATRGYDKRHAHLTDEQRPLFLQPSQFRKLFAARVARRPNERGVYRELKVKPSATGKRGNPEAFVFWTLVDHIRGVRAASPYGGGPSIDAVMGARLVVDAETFDRIDASVRLMAADGA